MSTASFEYQRPYVLGTDLQRVWNLTWMLATTEFKLRFYGSVLGYAWTLARPFLFFGVIYLVFSEIAGLDANVKNYGVYILFGLVLFQFFGDTTNNSVRCLVAREGLLRKVRFPRLVIPMAVLLYAIFNLSGTLAAALIFATATGVYPTWSWLELPVIIMLVGAFATGIGLMLSAFFVRYRDIEPIWDVASQMLFYVSPILYVATLVPEQFRDLYLLNPLATLLTEMRVAVVDPSAPHPWDVGSPAVVVVSVAIVAVTLALGIQVFNRQAPRIAEEL
jgi:ABC-2 type transport system permease protein